MNTNNHHTLLVYNHNNKCNKSNTSMAQEGAKEHFVLVHGAGHGAWCWYKLTALLEAAGHAVTAIDLGASGVDSRTVEELESVGDYVESLMKAMAALPEGERVVIVGHSLGGMSISLAMQEFPEKIAAAVFATAIISAPGRPLAESLIECHRRNPVESMMDAEFYFGEDPDCLPTSIKFGPQLMATNFYQLCSLEDIKLATMLVRPSKFFVREVSDGALLTEERFGSVPMVYIKCTQDKVLKEDMQQWMIERASVNEVMVIDTDHMVMLSKPLELFHCLVKVAHTYL